MKKTDFLSKICSMFLQKQLFNYKEPKNRLTFLLILDLIQEIHKSAESQSFKKFLDSLFIKKLDLILNYFIEYDLDSKGIANLAYYLEEEFKERFEAFIKNEFLVIGESTYRCFV